MIFSLIKKYRETLLYLVFGVLTTAVNFAALWAAGIIFGQDAPVFCINIPAWLISVLFAYFTNKAFVFENLGWSFKIVSRELVNFFAARVLSFVFEDMILLFGCDIMSLNRWYVKLFAAVFVVIFNYVASKLFIFRKNKKGKEE